MIKPAGHRVLVFPEEVKEKTDSGIIIPVTTRDREQAAVTRGTVIAIGPTAWKAFDDGNPWCQVGDIVAFARYGGYEVEDPTDGEKYRVLNDEDIVAVIS